MTSTQKKAIKVITTATEFALIFALVCFGLAVGSRVFGEQWNTMELDIGCWMVLGFAALYAIKKLLVKMFQRHNARRAIEPMKIVILRMIETAPMMSIEDFFKECEMNTKRFEERVQKTIEIID